jgi:CBS domain containing-hemolysin-like protein
LLVIFDLLVIACRASYLQTNQARLLAFRAQFEQKVNRANSLLQVLQRLRASLNLALVIARFLLAWLVLWVALLRPVRYPELMALLVLLTSALLLFWLEWSIERGVSSDPEKWALRLVGFARFWMAVVSPLLLPLAFSGEKQTNPESPGAVTEDELMNLVDAGQEEGLFEQGERQMIHSIIDLRDTLAREIMVPRIDMLALDVHTPLDAAVDALLKSGYSRVPVFDETVDRTLGLLYAKDLLRVWRQGEQLHELRGLLRPVHFIPEAKRVDELMAEMQAQRIHMSIVVDEYGGVAGLVTLEDIVEEILGEIQDEYDQAEEAPYQKTADQEYIFLGRVDIDDFNEVMGSQLSKDEADTLGGFIYQELGRVPNVGDSVQQKTLMLTVEQVSGRRIRKVRARWLPAGEQPVEEEKNVDGRDA